MTKEEREVKRNDQQMRIQSHANFFEKMLYKMKNLNLSAHAQAEKYGITALDVQCDLFGVLEENLQSYSKIHNDKNEKIQKFIRDYCFEYSGYSIRDILSIVEGYDKRFDEEEFSDIDNGEEFLNKAFEELSEILK